MVAFLKKENGRLHYPFGIDSKAIVSDAAYDRELQQEKKEERKEQDITITKPTSSYIELGIKTPELKLFKTLSIKNFNQLNQLKRVKYYLI